MYLFDMQYKLLHGRIATNDMLCDMDIIENRVSK